jgi:hypothetical protein
MYFLAEHVEMDCLQKRNKRGYAFFTGDELPYPKVSRHQVDTLIGDQLDRDLKVSEVVAALNEKFHPFFLIPDPDRRARCERTWRDLLGDHVICMESPEDTCYVAASLVALTEGVAPSLNALDALLVKAGAPKDRAKATIRAVLPYAALLGKDR